MKEMDKFKLEETDSFDARHGYSRWVSRGFGTRTSERGSLLKAEIWIDRQGQLVTRFKSPSQGYCLHFKIQPVGTYRITPADKEDVENFLGDMLTKWVVDGLDNDWED